MSYGFKHPQPDDEEPAALTKEVRVRVLNCSATGCLVESSGPVAVGTVAVLRITFGRHEFNDAVQIVRCQAIQSADDVYHLGARFLSTTPPYAGALRYVMLAGWLRTSHGLRP